MIDISKIKIGDKVHYQPEQDKEENRYENGIIKSITKYENDSVFVVYNCAGDWNNYKNYTAANTNIRNLYLGWKH